MVLIISGTNRPNSKTKMVADHIANNLADKAKVLCLEEFAKHINILTMYDPDAMAEELQQAQDLLWIPADKIIMISPEYNGSFSGILKVFIDALSVRKYGETFKDKKVALVGVASGRAGNLRGLEHLTGLLNYLKMHVYPVKVPISQVGQLMIDGKLDPNAMKDLDNMISEFVEKY